MEGFTMNSSLGSQVGKRRSNASNSPTSGIPQRKRAKSKVSHASTIISQRRYEDYARQDFGGILKVSTS
jgi:hypothetical protein